MLTSSMHDSYETTPRRTLNSTPIGTRNIGYSAKSVENLSRDGFLGYGRVLIRTSWVDESLGVLR